MARSSNFSQVTSKKELLALQREFARMIRRPLIGYSKMRRDKNAAAMIKSNDRSGPEQRLEFYAQQYWWRIIDSLDEDFPSVRKLLSRRSYQTLRLAYLDRCPSQSFTLRNLGARFPAYIKKNPKFTATKTALIWAAAKFDWATIETFDQAEWAPITTDMLNSPHFLTKKLFLQPHIQLIELNYPIHTLFKQGRRESSDGASNTLVKRATKTSSAKKISLKKERCFLAIHRFQNRPHVKVISATEYTILKTFRGGCSLTGLTKSIKSFKSISDEQLQQSFAEWMALGWLSIK